MSLATSIWGIWSAAIALAFLLLVYFVVQRHAAVRTDMARMRRARQISLAVAIVFGMGYLVGTWWLVADRNGLHYWAVEVTTLLTLVFRAVIVCVCAYCGLLIPLTIWSIPKKEDKSLSQNRKGASDNGTE